MKRLVNQLNRFLRYNRPLRKPFLVALLASLSIHLKLTEAETNSLKSLSSDKCLYPLIILDDDDLETCLEGLDSSVGMQKLSSSKKFLSALWF